MPAASQADPAGLLYVAIVVSRSLSQRGRGFSEQVRSVRSTVDQWNLTPAPYRKKNCHRQRRSPCVSKAVLQWPKRCP